MGLRRLSWVVLLLLSCVHYCFGGHGGGGGSGLVVKFVKAPLPFSSLNSAAFGFEVLESGHCGNCSFQCKLDNGDSLNCDAREVSYTGLLDGNHTLEVCTNGSKGVRCSSYNWIVDTVAPTAYVNVATPFTNALNVTVDIAFSEPCTFEGGFQCSSVNTCNLLVYGAGEVIPSSVTVVQPNLRYAVVVGLSPVIQYGRVVLVMDKNFCKDAAGNRFTRTTNSSFLLRFDRRNVSVKIETRIPEKLLQLNREERTVEATNDSENLKVYLSFSVPVLNSSDDILRVLQTSSGSLVPTHRRSHGNRRFGFLVQNISSIAIVTISLSTSSIISRQGTPVSSIDPLTFLYDSRRPSVRLSTTSKMKTRDHSVPVLIRFMKPVFDFNSSAIIVKGGHLLSFREVSGRIYTVEIHADDTTVSVQIPENTTEDVAGNKNLVSNLLRVQHYSVPIVSQVLASVTTAAFALSSVTAMLLTLSTASLQSLGTVSRPSSYLTSEPSRNLLRFAYHIQVFAQSKWLVVTLPIEYYEFARGLQWSIPYLTLPWESHSHPFMVDSNVHVLMQSQLKRTKKDASMLGSPLTPTEYQSYFESIDIKPEAEFIGDPRSSNGWKYFERNMFWLAVIGGSLILSHALLVLILRFRRKDSGKEINYGALVVPRFEIFLTLLALPCISQASTAIVRGGSTAGVVVGVLLLGLLSILLLSLFLFLSIGITSGKLLQYKEVHREGQKSHWYQELVRVTLGPGKRGQWTWKDQPNSTRLVKLGPLFEDLRGPPKYMLSQIAAGGPDPGKRGNHSIIASDDETEDAEAPFIQKLFGILRIYYAFLESLKRVALGVCAGLSSITAPSKVPVLVILSISSFQLLFMMLKKPFIKKKVQFVETVSVAAEVGVFASCLALSEGDLSSRGERRVGIFMLILFAIAFASQVINEWYALYRQVLHLSPDQNSFFSGSKAAIIGFLSVFLPSKLIMNLEDRVSSNSVNSSLGDSDRMRNPGVKASEPAEKPWRRQLKELARASFGRDERKGATTTTSGDPSSSGQRKRSRSSSGGGFWGGKRSGSSDTNAKSKSLYRDLETIFSSK